jgi:hypothetical protein
MGKLQCAAMLAFVLGLTSAAAPAQTAPSATIAESRCNSQTIDSANARIREYDRHAPSSSPPALLARYAAIADIISTLGEEHGILDSVCASDSQKAPLFVQIAETTAWALALEADVAARLNVACPAGAKAFPTMMLADAWLTLANVVNDQDGTVPPAFGEVVPKIQTRAASVGLALPPWPETSQYWRDQISTKEKAQIATCPSPSPAARPS